MFDRFLFKCLQMNTDDLWHSGMLDVMWKPHSDQKEIHYSYSAKQHPYLFICYSIKPGTVTVMSLYDGHSHKSELK